MFGEDVTTSGILSRWNFQRSVSVEVGVGGWEATMLDYQRCPCQTPLTHTHTHEREREREKQREQDLNDSTKRAIEWSGSRA